MNITPYESFSEAIEALKEADTAAERSASIVTELAVYPGVNAARLPRIEQHLADLGLKTKIYQRIAISPAVVLELSQAERDVIYDSLRIMEKKQLVLQQAVAAHKERILGSH